MLEGAECDVGVKVAIFFVELCACLRKSLLILWCLLFPMAFLESGLGIFKGRFV